MKLSILLAALAFAVTVPAGAEWKHVEKTSTLTKHRSTGWWVEANEKAPTLLGSMDYPKLGILCVEKATLIRLTFNHRLKENSLVLKYRLDDGVLKQSPTGVTRDGLGLGLDGAAAISLIKDMASSQTLAAGIKPADRKRLDAVFDLKGIATPIADIRKECGW